MLNWQEYWEFFQNHYIIIISTIIIIKISYFLYQSVQPFDKNYTVYEPAYGPTPENFIKHQLGSLPTIYPYGWSPLLKSRDLKKRQVLSVSKYYEDLVLYRDGSGEVHVFDAFCPHLGANIGIGGTVEGSDRLRCPFHSWTFNTEGQCVDVPGLDKDNLPKASLKKWVSAERNRMIWIWRHPDEPEPKWPCVNMPNVDGDKLIYLGRSAFDVMFTIQDFGENTFDLYHFSELHNDIKALENYPLPTGSGLKKLFIEFLRLIIGIRYDISRCGITFPEFKTPLLVGQLPKATLHLMGVPLAMDMTLQVEITNPYTFFYRYTAPGLSIIWHSNVLPLSPGKLRVVQHFYTENFTLTNRFFAGFEWPFLTNILLQQDSPILQNKLHRVKPHLTKLDSGIVTWRRWLNQFHGKTKTGADDKIAKDD